MTTPGVPGVDRIKTIAYAASFVFGIPADRLMSTHRASEYTQPRYAAFYVARKSTGAMMSVIGAALGHHHTTVSNGVLKAEQRIEVDPAYRASVERVEDICKQWGVDPEFDALVVRAALGVSDDDPEPAPVAPVVPVEPACPVARDNIDCVEDREMRAMIAKGTRRFAKVLSRGDAA